ncbi:MAG TPA: Ku protein [Polyangiaceae bacterium]|jgi:DNA end-binding protein Ku|nr:Ku protein [Polyangiaceae bacterium]
MPARALSSATISFGLVAIPVKLYTATSSQQVHFNMLHPETKTRVQQQYITPATGAVVDRASLVKGYEYARGQYVVFTDEELKALETERSNSIDIVEFVPLSTVDLLSVEKTYYLGPDKGGDKAYRLLTESMQRTQKIAVGRWAARGKEQLVLLRPYKAGLVLHQMFYANEVRAFDEVDTGATFQFKDIELNLAENLIAQLSHDAFDAARYKDEYATRVLAAVDQKVAGQQIHVAQEVPKAQVIDLFEALKQSLEQAQTGSTPKGPVKASTERADEAEVDEEVQARPVKKAIPRKTRGRKAS